jgi:hypothetical protein
MARKKSTSSKFTGYKVYPNGTKHPLYKKECKVCKKAFTGFRTTVTCSKKECRAEIMTTRRKPVMSKKIREDAIRAYLSWRNNLIRNGFEHSDHEMDAWINEHVQVQKLEKKLARKKQPAEQPIEYYRYSSPLTWNVFGIEGELY